MEAYRASLKRRRGKTRRFFDRVALELREPLDAALALGLIFGSALLLTWVLPF
jgi:hypothetical protein